NNLPSAPPGGTIPQGNVQFLDGATPIICNEGGTSIQPLNGSSQATCTTSTITPAGSPHTINANYQGNGNFDPSSGSVQQTVIACSTNPVVTSTGDSGAGTLRDAIANVCNGSTITFNIAGPGPHTIALTSGELAVAKNVTINNNSGKRITVSGGGLSRVFNINLGKTAAIIGLTISGYGSGVEVLRGTTTDSSIPNTNNHGDNDNGGGGGPGGLRNQGGTLTMHNT